MHEAPDFVPKNNKGKPLDIEYSIVENTEPGALEVYEIACGRLLNPSVWKQVAGPLSATFTLVKAVDAAGNTFMEEGDFLQIDIPGPGSAAGDGYDWVTVERRKVNVLEDADTSLGITLRATRNPGKQKEAIAHFFKADATSTFIIQKNGLNVKASYYGRNEIPNTEDVPLVDKVRNAITGAGAIAGISNMQWSALIKGLLKKEI